MAVDVNQFPRHHLPEASRSGWPSAKSLTLGLLLLPCSMSSRPRPAHSWLMLSMTMTVDALGLSFWRMARHVTVLRREWRLESRDAGRSNACLLPRCRLSAPSRPSAHSAGRGRPARCRMHGDLQTGAVRNLPVARTRVRRKFSRRRRSRLAASNVHEQEAASSLGRRGEW